MRKNYETEDFAYSDGVHVDYRNNRRNNDKKKSKYTPIELVVLAFWIDNRLEDAARILRKPNGKQYTMRHVYRILKRVKLKYRKN